MMTDAMAIPFLALRQETSVRRLPRNYYVRNAHVAYARVVRLIFVSARQGCASVARTLLIALLEPPL